MSRIKGFLDFTRINEAENSSQNILQIKYPELWKRLEDLGYRDEASSIMRKNGTLWLFNPIQGFNPNGYKLVTKSGNITAGAYSKAKRLDLPNMVRYMEDVYARLKKIATRGSDGDPKISKIINSITRASWNRNQKTGRFDINGDVYIPNEKISEFFDSGIKLGRIKGDLIIYFEFHSKGICDISPYMESFSFDHIGGNIKIETSNFPSNFSFNKGNNISLTIDKEYNGNLVFKNRGHSNLRLNSDFKGNVEFGNKESSMFSGGNKKMLGDIVFNNKGPSFIDNVSKIEGDVIFNDNYDKKENSIKSCMISIYEIGRETITGTVSGRSDMRITLSDFRIIPDTVEELRSFIKGFGVIKLNSNHDMDRVPFYFDEEFVDDWYLYPKSFYNHSSSMGKFDDEYWKEIIN
jgi:hypothetical protein